MGLDIGASTVGLIRSVPKVNAFGNQTWKGFGPTIEGVTSGRMLMETYDQVRWRAMSTFYIVVFFCLYTAFFLVMRKLFMSGHRWAWVCIVLSIPVLGGPLGLLRSGSIEETNINIFVCFFFPALMAFFMARLVELRNR